MKKDSIEIHETAFVTSSFRSSNDELSGDRYAKLWGNSKTEDWVDSYLEQVSSEERATHCLRNRYFLDTIKELVSTGELEILINFGSGFSMYPFLLSEEVVHIEIDKPEIVDYKEDQIKNWQLNNILPARNIHFIGIDFSEDYKQDLHSQILSITDGRPSLILIEGVLFFLNRKDTDNLFDFFNRIQNKGDYIGSASFPDAMKETLAFKKLLDFFSQKVSSTKASDYQTIQEEYYHSRSGYKLIDHQDYFSLSEKYGNEILLNKNLILNEHFYLLKKT